MNWLKRWVQRTKKSGHVVASFDTMRDDLKSCMKDVAKLEYRLIELETKVNNLESFIKYMQP